MLFIQQPSSESRLAELANFLLARYAVRLKATLLNETNVWNRLIRQIKAEIATLKNKPVTQDVQLNFRNKLHTKDLSTNISVVLLLYLSELQPTVTSLQMVTL